MEFYILMSFIWVIGWLYACGVHQGGKETVKQKGSAEDKKDIDKSVFSQYVILFFIWPHYIGYGK